MVRLIFLIGACVLLSGCIHIVVPSALSHMVTHSRFEKIGDRLDRLEGKKEEQEGGQRDEQGERIVYVPSIFRK